MMLQNMINFHTHGAANLSLSSANKNTTVLNPAGFFLNAQQSFHVNVTVTSMRYIGPESHICRYGGLLAVEIVGTGYVEDNTFCTNAISISGKSFYSSSSNLIVIFYWYQSYSEIETTLSLSETQCKPVRINSCTYHSLCDQLTNVDGCTAYLNKVTAGSNISLTLDRRRWGKWNTVAFSLPDNFCFMLQLIKYERNISVSEVTDVCEINLLPRKIQTFGMQIHYTILGVFSPVVLPDHKRTLYEEHPDVNTNWMDEVCFAGVVDSFCHYQNGTFACQHDKHFRGVNCFVLETSIFEQTSVYALITSKTPTFTNIMQLAIAMSPQTKSWIDIILSKEIVSQNPIDYLSEFITLYQRQEVKKIPDYQAVAFLKVPQSNESLSLKVKVGSMFLGESEFELVWQKNLTIFSHISVEKYISLAHDITYVQLDTQNEDYNSTLSFLWIIDVCCKQFPVLKKHSHSAHLSICLNFVASSFNRSFTGCNKFYLLLKKAKLQSLKEGKIPETDDPCNRTKDDYLHQHLKSWTKASDLCREAGGNLPDFTSRKDLEELIALLKLSTDLLPIEALYSYIGLKFNKRRNVSSLSAGLWFKLEMLCSLSDRDSLPKICGAQTFHNMSKITNDMVRNQKNKCLWKQLVSQEIQQN